MEIYSVNGDFYMSYDLAVIKCAGTHFVIKKHELDETEYLEVDYHKQKISIMDESGQEYEIEFDAEYTFHEREEFCDSYTEFYILDIQIEGHSITTMNISNHLKKDIENEVESVAYKIAEYKHENR